MMFLLHTKFRKIQFSTFRGVALTNFVMDKPKTMSPHQSWGGGDIIVKKSLSSSHDFILTESDMYYLSHSTFVTLNNAI